MLYWKQPQFAYCATFLSEVELTFLSIARPIQTHTKGNLCTKFVVPSSGSMIHVGASVRLSTEPCSAEDSSPMNACSGYLRLMVLMIVLSHF